jgi:hypothetical protein
VKVALLDQAHVTTATWTDNDFNPTEIFDASTRQ